MQGGGATEVVGAVSQGRGGGRQRKSKLRIIISFSGDL